MVDFHGRFLWYELMTTDVEGAKAFYGKVVGWRARDASMPGAAYTLFTVGNVSVSGLMVLSEDAMKMGATPRWIGYVGVNDVDVAVEQVMQLGGTVHVPPTDVSNVSRFSVIADPQMAMLGLIRVAGREQPLAPGKPGRAGWHELLAADREKAWAFYGELFGWQKAGAVVDEIGTYQLFSAGGQTIGGMFDKPAAVPIPFWLYYFNIGDIGAAAERVKAGGGLILEGPVALLNGGRVALCRDPQGAMFALTASPRDKAIGYFERDASRGLANTRGRRWNW
ncbi:MAG TPA: VOC family protein [Xanthobacteraceae bacterium]|nr:VOC family protein [Xanthobacteraceae bacterium]